MLNLISGGLAGAKIALVLFVVLPKFSGPDVAHPGLGRALCGVVVLVLLVQALRAGAGAGVDALPSEPRRGRGPA